VVQELLGERFWDWLVTDRWSASSRYPSWCRQRCWARLLRDIEAMGERGECSREIVEALRAQAHEMFHWRHQVRAGILTPTSFARYMRPIRHELAGCWRSASRLMKNPKSDPARGRSSGTICQTDLAPSAEDLTMRGDDPPQGRYV
jgi:Transposase IS66 family